MLFPAAKFVTLCYSDHQKCMFGFWLQNKGILLRAHSGLGRTHLTFESSDPGDAVVCRERVARLLDCPVWGPESQV